MRTTSDLAPHSPSNPNKLASGRRKTEHVPGAHTSWIIWCNQVSNQWRSYWGQGRLSAKAFSRKPFPKRLPQDLHRKAFYEPPHRQGLNDKSAKAFSRKPFPKPLPQDLHRKAFYELTHRQGLNDKSAKAFPSKPFRKPFPQN
ncbi:hypothetical protein AVEN_1898-1 [Araneus ventricosus]|uniref:Uncharacterized protein n=1 Tax=Araneus ventricosus TaxID=182803 RepID=A0A4Y2TGZ3_ARAVE|nr:hypothetical protein AVEN_1898-1 [Araneus ventricosus]